MPLILAIADPDAGAGIAAIMLIVFAGILYFLPSIIGRSKQNSTAIFALNLLLGWTLVGWVVALVWALAHEKTDVPESGPPPRIILNEDLGGAAPAAFCSSCGKYSPAGARFCGSCGQPIAVRT
jgi:hypothetical protein